ncbi:hypothetical protein SAMN02745121_06694 [Nannocystis exedens]|uniref:Uncharacterized protein n=1 Tax=Nannocystis exedens TaxID=54 RepID=A0A1I2FM10_9BACT|nr:hypothetical protein NAEX_07530 [Nannocystis exedens]SFF05777.1 hypothetical protein SAMN02745121_06694 [Nannocystis exedens]
MPRHACHQGQVRSVSSGPRLGPRNWTGAARAPLPGPPLVRLVQKLSARSGRGVGHQLGEHPRRTRASRDAVAHAQTGGIATSCPRGQVGGARADFARRRGGAGHRGAVLEPRRLLAGTTAPGPALAFSAVRASGLGLGGGLAAAGEVLGDGDRAMALAEGRCVPLPGEITHPGSTGGRSGSERVARASDRAERLRGPRSVAQNLGGAAAASRSHRLFHGAASMVTPRSIPRAAVRPDYMHTGSLSVLGKRRAPPTPPRPTAGPGDGPVLRGTSIPSDAR